jgi:FlaA1/EpsC-like NDP-sugar epimerase
MRPSFRNRYLLLCDTVALLVVPLVAYMVRFEGLDWAPADTQALVLFTLIAVPWKLGLFLSSGLYQRLWSQASLSDLIGIVRAATISAAGAVVLGALILPAAGVTQVRVPLSVLLLDAFATITVVAGPRLLAKVLRSGRRHRRRASDPAALIVGAGPAGELIAKEMLANPSLALRPVGFVDDDPRKRGHQLCGLPVLGSLDELPAVIRQHRVGEVVIAMPEARGSLVRSVVRAAGEAGVHTRTVPSLSEILNARVRISALRNVQIQDLLRRDPVHTDLAAVRVVLSGRTVLVTGAGGSIGSELCQQIARLGPSRLLLVGHGENSIFDIQAALRASNPEIETVPLIADVRDRARMREILGRFRPTAVFHAAAHKHVPLMEQNVAEAILNNVRGTMSVVDAAVEAGTDHFVLISTDKAVRPCSVMGITKRIAEMVVQRAALEHDRHFVAVRFGNVLGSRGSVVPTFLQQIEAGGPVTVTHPDMRRYFMTIPEAVQLVLQAGALGHRGEVFVLDMGEPVKIVDLARDLIRLSGLEPDQDIEIRFTGMRPGERLDEEVLVSGESVVPTMHPKVLRATNGGLPADVGDHIRTLVAAAEERQPDDILRLLLRVLVPEFPLGELGPSAAAAAAETNGHAAGNGRVAVTGDFGRNGDAAGNRNGNGHVHGNGHGEERRRSGPMSGSDRAPR